MILALVLGGAMPLLLAWLAPSGDDIELQMWGDMLLMVAVVTSSGLYLSSLCSSGMRAVVVALPVGAGLIVFLRWIGWLIPWAMEYVPLAPLGRTLRPFRFFMARNLEWLVLPVALGGVALLLGLALRNHRSAERSSKRLLSQAAMIAGYIVASVTFLTVCEILIRAAMRLPRP